MTPIGTFTERVLDEIEECELRFLVWGVVDGYLTEADLDDLINSLLDSVELQDGDGFISVNDVLFELEKRGLIFEIPGITPKAYRSRMAESVRLLFRLRQLFPKHAVGNRWQQAQTLVSDFRFVRRRREYPARDIVPAEAIGSITGLSEPQKMILDVLLTDRIGLAAFQVRAVERVMHAFGVGGRSATLISAGTGSGKTLAFYLPALMHIAGRVVQDSSDQYGVKCLALYPRTELLLDQFNEVYLESIKLNAFFKSSGSRKIRIGAYFGETLKNVDDTYSEIWERNDSGLVSKWMSCPQEGCGGDMYWSVADMRNGVEALRCLLCEFQTEPGAMGLTRQSLESQPPDILFTTTEMLNQRMSDVGTRRVFGLSPQSSSAPDMVLLDEVHTYAGFHGAQVGYLLRRWQQQVRLPVSFVALSATIEQGTSFVSTLTGVEEGNVLEIKPNSQTEMEKEGAEYMIALRGDPVSRTALLSTTIQTTMLMTRVLDPGGQNLSRGFYGSRVFNFVDDLDVVNRLYHQMLDAEGRDSFGRRDLVRHPNGSLAGLRNFGSRVKEQCGQDWWMPRSLGHDIVEPKLVGRTSSQDAGVSVDRDIIVATAKLEVGFNDVKVGAVIQHKAPHDAATFVQRKGRAGRLRGMRPWTAVVLSDYGRDRLQYQAYDQLFDPEISAKSLPLESRYVKGMQAVYALFDYLAETLPPNFQTHVWKVLSEPYFKKGRYLEKLIEILETLIKDPSQTERLARHLERSLRLSEEEVQNLLWEHPRPLMTTVIPTALRRLRSNWSANYESKADYWVRNSPLPEFVPSNLFSDLNLPEVRIVVPSRELSTTDQKLPVGSALREFAPGRVSRRYGITFGLESHWIGPSDSADILQTSVQSMDLTDYVTGSDAGTWQELDSGEVKSWPVLRVREMSLEQVPKEIEATSNARLNWHTQIAFRNGGIVQTPPASTPWQKLIVQMEAFTHAGSAPVEVRRFARSSDADVKFRSRDQLRTRFEFVYQDRPLAIGFSIEVDALRFEIVPPDMDFRDESDDQGTAVRALRKLRFLDAALEGDGFTAVENRFAREWLANIYLTAVTYEAMNSNVTVEQADARLFDGRARYGLAQILETIFQSPVVSDEEADDESEGGGVGSDRLRQDIEDYLDDDNVVSQLRELATYLWDPIDESWNNWHALRYKAALGGALVAGITSLCRQIDSEDLVLDLNPGPRASESDCAGTTGQNEIWISETGPGGTGLVELFLRAYAEDPRRFYALVSASLRPNEYEHIDHLLNRYLNLVAGSNTEDSIIDGVLEFRTAKGLEKDSKLVELRRTLSDLNFYLSHGFLVALLNRLIREGSNSETDAYMYQAMELWESQEVRLGLELDARVIAFYLAQSDKFDRTLSNLGFPAQAAANRQTWRFTAISSLLWPRGSSVRGNTLQNYNPYLQIPQSDRLLVYEHLEEGSRRLSIDGSETWREEAWETLSREGAITLCCNENSGGDLAKAINFFATNPVECDYLSLYARIDSFRRVGETYELDLEIAEITQ